MGDDFLFHHRVLTVFRNITVVNLHTNLKTLLFKKKTCEAQSYLKTFSSKSFSRSVSLNALHYYLMYRKSTRISTNCCKKETTD